MKADLYVVVEQHKTDHGEYYVLLYATHDQSEAEALSILGENWRGVTKYVEADSLSSERMVQE